MYFIRLVDLFVIEVGFGVRTDEVLRIKVKRDCRGY